MVSAFGREATAHFCKISAFKYLWRLGYKDDEAQEIGKIKWYLDKYLELTKPPIGLRLDTGEPIYESGIAISEEGLLRFTANQNFSKGGLTDREVATILNK